MNHNIDQVLTEFIELEKESRLRCEKIKQTQIHINELQKEIDAILNSKTEFNENIKKLNVIYNKLQIELNSKNSQIIALKEQQEIEFNKKNELESQLKKLDEERLRLLKEFEILYKEFISDFDVNFDLRSVYESLKQTQLSNHVNVISQYENDIKNLEQLKSNIKQHQEWSAEVEKMNDLEKDLTNKLNRLKLQDQKLGKFSNNNQNKSSQSTIEDDLEMKELKKQLEFFNEKSNEQILSSLKQKFKYLNNQYNERF